MSKEISFVLTKKKILALLAAATLTASVAGYTAATFSAQTRNPGNVISSGTLVLSNQKNSATACFSNAGTNTNSNVNNSCDQLFNSTVIKPGDSATVDVTMRNAGSLNGLLSMYMNSCTTTDTAESYHGTGNMCQQLQLTVQEYSDSGRTTPSTCTYGGGTASTCAYAAGKNLNDFATNYTSGANLALGAQNAGVSRYYRINVLFPTSSDNTFQGRAANFDFTWVLNQA